MPGRPLCSDAEAERRGFRGAANARRRQVLRETLSALDGAADRSRYETLALDNLERWREKAAGVAVGSRKVQIHRGDWGDVTGALTRQHGACFAVLNMANSHVPGGASRGRSPRKRTSTDGPTALSSSTNISATGSSTAIDRL